MNAGGEPGLPAGYRQAVERAEEHADELFDGRPSERYVESRMWADGDFVVEVIHAMVAAEEDIGHLHARVRYKASHGRMVYDVVEQKVWETAETTVDEEVLEEWYPEGVEPGQFDHHSVPEEPAGG